MRRSFLWRILFCACAVFASNAAAPNGTNRFAEHIANLRKPEGFTGVIERPFVVLGDEAPWMVSRRATNSVRWAVRKLKQDYFARDPEEIIDIWLFRDRQSYTNHAWTLFGDTPTSPFGYYSGKHRALIMNIATGGGTLVHEMVHAFMAANFPQCPAWFNEGLASLYEASSEKDGHIRGLINWRYKGLEQAIQTHKTISFQELTAKNSDDFYGGVTYGAYYAQARYLCYYMQEKGLLIQFYREFARNVGTDPTGYATLKRTLGESDMADFQRRWERYILDLKGAPQ